MKRAKKNAKKKKGNIEIKNKKKKGEKRKDIKKRENDK